MENRPVLKVLSLLGLLLLFFPRTLSAYDDARGGAHQAINREALALFEREFFRENGPDPYLRLASFSDREYPGIDWEPQDGTCLLGPRIEVQRSKLLRQWIIEGGFSADEPEGPMALLHFFDPTQSSQSWLTDQQWLTKFIRRLGGSTFDHPERDAVTWAFQTRSDDTSEFLGLFDQEYGFPQAKEYLKKAMESKDPQDLYGKAWRAVGEVMHLVADMTVPAHVRNDGHAAILGDADPYEMNTSGDEVATLLQEGTPAKLHYFRLNAETLMREVARYTNANFFSKDTIPGKYSSPRLEDLKEGETGFSLTTQDGYTYRALGKAGFLSRWWSKRIFVIDSGTIRAQQRILVPTAVHAASGVLYAFLPRFQVEATITPLEGQEGLWQVVGRITHHPNFQWPEKLTIRNGAFVVVEKNGQTRRIPVVKPGDSPLDSFVTRVEADEESHIFVEYDFGGYCVRNPEEDSSGTYRGEMTCSDPNLTRLGLKEYRVPFTLTLQKDGQATMTYAHEGSLSIPLGEGTSLLLRYALKAELQGNWKNGQVVLEGEEWGYTEVIPPAVPPEVQEMAPTLGGPQKVEGRNPVRVEGTIRNGTVVGQKILEGYPTPQTLSGKKEKNP